MSAKKKSAYAVPKLKDFSDATLVKAVHDCLHACQAEADAVQTEAESEGLRDRWLGRKTGILTQINEQWLRAAPKDAKKNVGAQVNQLRLQIETRVTDAELSVSAQKKTQSLAEDRVDIPLPGIRRPLGAEHPVIKTMNEMVGVFRDLGYSAEEGPEMETDYYNFEALNFPPNHPARDTQDTLFLANQEGKPVPDRLL